MGSDSALRMFVLVALALHQVLGTSSAAMPIPCLAPSCFPSPATCPQATPCPGGLAGVSVPQQLPRREQEVGDMEITPKTNHEK